jgi:dipeptidyl aminopeptidase/acylaminoacyl peptidase
MSRSRRWIRALPLALTLVPLAVAAEPAGFTPGDVARLRSVTAVAMSPDGARIAYVLAVPRRPIVDEDGPAWAELHVVGRDGVDRPFVTGQVDVSAPAWTPDGSSIAFLAKRGKDEARSLYLIPSSGGEARRVEARSEDITGYDFSPDGKRIAFLSREELPKARRELEKKGFNQEVVDEDARPVKIWIASRNGAGAAAPRKLEIPGSASELHWSPTDSRLAVALAPTSLVDAGYMERRVAVVDADAGRVLVRLENPGKLGAIAWSPDGKSLAFLSAADLHDPSAGRLMIASASGGPIRDALPGYEGNVADIAWQSADQVTYIGDEGVGTVFARVRSDGIERRTILPGGQPVLTAFDLSGDGRSAAMIGQTPQHPAEVFLWTQESPAPRRLTVSNPWLGAVRLAPQEVVTFRARDGLSLEGILIHPLDEEPGRRYPLILTVHGGPEGHFRNGWLTNYSEPGQLGAARGFAVFYPNYRGSTGRGVDFSKLSQGDPAGKEFDDLVDAVDALVAAGRIDRARVGVTGGSYGGYATAWCATRYSDRFAAGVMFVGISDLVSKAGTTEIPEEEYLVHARRRPWEDWPFMLARSPIFYAEKARTPLLILDGRDDPRVHPSQSLVLYRYLKALDHAPVRLVYYPGEKHGNRRSASRYDYNLRMIRWFEHYLRGPGGAAPPYELDYGEGAGPDGDAPR